jgi:hypothetical protein
MDTLLEITLRSNLVEKLSMAMYDCLFEAEDEYDENSESKVSWIIWELWYYLRRVFVQLDGTMSLEEYDHIAVASVHAFLQVIFVFYLYFSINGNS